MCLRDREALSLAGLEARERDAAQGDGRRWDLPSSVLGQASPALTLNTLDVALGFTGPKQVFLFG